MERAVAIAIRVKGNGSALALDRLIAASAIVLREGWSDPRDRVVLDAAEQLATRLAAVQRRRFTREETAAGERVWREAVDSLPTNAEPWIEQLRVGGLTEDGLWIAGPAGVVAWVAKRYQTVIEKETGCNLRLVASERGER